MAACNWHLQRQTDCILSIEMGKNVDQFPLMFKDEITQPLAVFDYDKQRNYRFLITQNKNLLMYDSKGKAVKDLSISWQQSVEQSTQTFSTAGEGLYCLQCWESTQTIGSPWSDSREGKRVD